MSCKEGFKNKVKVFFDSLNGGGPVSVVQLAEKCRGVYPDLTNQQVIKMMQGVDGNNDMEVTWDEFSEALNKPNSKDVTCAELERRFKEFDKDGSGKLSRDEVRQMSKHDLTEEQLDAILAGCDPNNDGVVSYQEFLQAWKDQE